MDGIPRWYDESVAQPFTGVRITIHTKQSFETTMQKLYASIGIPDKAAEWPKITSEIKDRSEESRNEFKRKVEDLVGRHGFMIYSEIDHGAWVPLFNVGFGMQCKRIILGNPLIAITMLQHDMAAGLSVPIELLVLQKHDKLGGGVDCIYQLPSYLVASLSDNKELIAAAKVLDGKIKTLVMEVSGYDDPDLEAGVTGWKGIEPNIEPVIEEV